MTIKELLEKVYDGWEKVSVIWDGKIRYSGTAKDALTKISADVLGLEVSNWRTGDHKLIIESEFLF